MIFRKTHPVSRIILLKKKGGSNIILFVFSGLDEATIFESKFRLSFTLILGEYRIFLLAFLRGG